MPKDTDLPAHSQEEFDAIADLMNNRPRQTLDWHSAHQAFKLLMLALDEKACATID